MRSIGLDLSPWVKKGLLQYHAARPTMYGLETHLAQMHKLVTDVQPEAVVVDPITNLLSVGVRGDVAAMLTRLIDDLKSRGITTLFTSLTSGPIENLESTDVSVSSLMDAWLLLRSIEIGGERNRGIYVLKSRGMAHSNQIREFRMSDRGIDLVPVYVGPKGVLTGSARLSQEAREKAVATTTQEETERQQRELDRKRSLMEAQIAAIKAQFESEEDELRRAIQQSQERKSTLQTDREVMAGSRRAPSASASTSARNNNRKGRRP